MTGLLDAPEADGLVERGPPSTDRRATLDFLTDPGRTARARVFHVIAVRV
ncbi:hypothetical protein ACFYNL_36380 [Streptomyces sp. NPDC007808]